MYKTVSKCQTPKLKKAKFYVKKMIVTQSYL